MLTSRAKSLDGVAVKAKQGVFLGGYAPFGYEIINQQYHIVPSEAAVVRKIFEMYADGAGYGTIIKEIGHVMGRRGRPIGENTLYYILRNVRYAGTYVWNKYINRVMQKWAGGKPNPNAVHIKNAIPAIIDKTTWERVQKRTSEKNTRAKNKAKQTSISALRNHRLRSLRRSLCGPHQHPIKKASKPGITSAAANTA